MPAASGPLRYACRDGPAPARLRLRRRRRHDLRLRALLRGHQDGAARASSRCCSRCCASRWPAASCGWSGGCGRSASRLTRRELGRLALIGLRLADRLLQLREHRDRAHERLGGRDPHRDDPDLRGAARRVPRAASGYAARQWAGILLSFAGIVVLVLAAGGAGGGSLTGNLLVLAASVSRRRLQHPGAAPAGEPLGAVRHHLAEPVRRALHGAAGAGRGAGRWGSAGPPLQAAGGVLFLTLVCSIVAYLLLNYAFRFLAGRAA